MHHKSVARFGLLALPAMALLAAPAVAQAQRYPGAWSDWNRPSLASRLDRRRDVDDSREGNVTAAQFAAEGAEDALGSGAIRLVALPDSTPGSRDRLVYEAAMIDRLVTAGYDTVARGDAPGQRAEIRIRQDMVEPAEEKRSPVSGETAIAVSNHGTAYGMALNLDFSRPRAALIATHMELQIRDEATNEVLWEARAQIVTRDGDERWDEDAIANRLAGALMEGFPHAG